MMIPLQAVVRVVIEVQYTRATATGIQLFVWQPVHFQVMIELRKVGLDRRKSVVIFVLGLTLDKVAAVLYTNTLNTRLHLQNAFVRILSESKLQRGQPGSQLYLQLQIH